MVKFSVFLISIIMLFSCTKKITINNSKKNFEKITEYSEDLSVFRPNYPDKEQIVEPKQNIPLPKSGPNISDTPSVEAVLLKMKETNKLLADSQGFRIHVFTGNQKEEFEAAKLYILKNFPDLEYYESYSHPTYKIKAGDFFKRSDADVYLDQMKGRFSSARIINDKINTKKALEIK